jgi:DNA-binding NtrC family response regulator
MKDKTKILVLDDEQRILDELGEFLTDYDYLIYKANKPSEAMEYFANNTIDIAIVDIRMPEMDGLTFLKKIKAEYPNTEVIMISGHGDMDSVVTALRNGASDFFQKPFRLPSILAAIQRTVRYHKLSTKFSELKSKYSLLTSELQNQMGFEIIGKSKKMEEVVRLMKKVAATSNTSVLIIGESGTGKELIAKAIHHMSDRSANIFYSVNCSAIPETLFESEFFGHIKGSFTGADDSRAGWFEIANNGTLFLDEIGDMPLSQQSKLLRVLEEKQVARVGSRKMTDFNVRVVTASNRSLQEMIRNNNFRLDLYHRISTFIIQIPPLRERKEDIPMLVDHFINKLGKEVGKNIQKVEDSVYEKLNQYDFPGNIRELRNIIERALILSEGKVLRSKDFHINEVIAFTGLPGNQERKAQETETEETENSFAMEVIPLHELEYITIIKVLIDAGYKKSKAAKMLGISYQVLLRKLKMQVPEYMKDNYGDVDFIESEYKRLSKLYHLENMTTTNLKEVEKEAVRKAMKVSKNKRDKAAKLLDISYQSICRKLQRIEL